MAPRQMRHADDSEPLTDDRCCQTCTAAVRGGRDKRPVCIRVLSLRLCRWGAMQAARHQGQEKISSEEARRRHRPERASSPGARPAGGCGPPKGRTVRAATAAAGGRVTLGSGLGWCLIFLAADPQRSLPRRAPLCKPRTLSTALEKRASVAPATPALAACSALRPRTRAVCASGRSVSCGHHHAKSRWRNGAVPGRGAAARTRACPRPAR